VRAGRAILAALAVFGAVLLVSAVQGLAGLDDRLEAETAQPRPVKLERAPRHERGQDCPFRDERQGQESRRET
jgi:hypothetical protein